VSDAIAGFAHAFALLFTPTQISACLLGLFVGLVGGFLPAISPFGTVALASSLAGALFVAFDEQSPVVFVVAVAYASLYGRALATRNLGAAEAQPVSGPDRSAMAGGLIAAIAIAAAMGVLAAVARPSIALTLGPAEMAAISVFLLLAAVAFATSSIAGALAVAAAGLLLAAVGTDIETGAPRFTLGISALEDGVPGVALGLFVVASAIHDWRHGRVDPPRDHGEDAPQGALRRTILSLLAGFLPTNGGLVATTTMERRLRPNQDIFDPANQSAPLGIFNAALAADIRFCASITVPLMVWFAPADVVAALLRRTISMQEILTKQISPGTDIVWLICATLILVHVVPLIMLLTAHVRWRPIRLDARVVAPLTVAVSCAFVFWITHIVFGDPLTRTLFNIAAMLVFGVVGYGMILFNLDRSVLMFAFLLEPNLEENFRRSMLIARGNVVVFFERPVSLCILAAGALLLIAVRLWWPTVARRQPA
jgi:TctA family transporter